LVGWGEGLECRRGQDVAVGATMGGTNRDAIVGKWNHRRGKAPTEVKGKFSGGAYDVGAGENKKPVFGAGGMRKARDVKDKEEK